MRLGEAATPPGLRLYAVGDVHGCREALEDVHARIDADLADRPPEDWRIVHLGDYIDRGPDSRGVIDCLIRRMALGRCYCLRGNHDQFMIDALGDPAGRGFGLWLRNGGADTLVSYGIDGAIRRRELHGKLIERVSPAHQMFLAGLPHSIRFADYLFVHAGLRPGVPLDEQSAEDLIWIREPFLTTGHDEVVTIHGHTPTESVEVLPYRVGVDTGAVYGGELSCVVIEGRAIALLGPNGPEPLR